MESGAENQRPNGKFFERRRNEITREPSATGIPITWRRHDRRGGRIFLQRDLKVPPCKSTSSSAGCYFARPQRFRHRSEVTLTAPSAVAALAVPLSSVP